MKKYLIFLISLTSFLTTWAQETQKQLKLISTDFTLHNDHEIPGATILSGNVEFEHDGARIFGNKVYYFQKEQYIKVFGNVRIIQGDSINLVGNYAEYNAKDKLAFIADQVKLRSKESTLVTDTLFYNRNIQQAYYNSKGVIHSENNVLTSDKGTYDVTQKKFTFRSKVEIKNPTTKLVTNHLDYFESSGHAYVYGKTWIHKSNGDKLYTENGFYDTKNNKSTLRKNPIIYQKNNIIEAEELDYDEKKGYARASNNIKITDTVNNFIVSGHYGEVFREKDSMYITKKALARYLVEQDTVYLHAKILNIVGPEGKRIFKGYNDARFFKSDMSGKSDSIVSIQEEGITKFLKRPVFWSNNSQITGDKIFLLADSTKKQLDSLKVLNNAFIIQKDTLSTGYNQMKGVNLYGKFKDKKINIIDLVKNTESIYYLYDKLSLIGIEKGVCSRIRLIIENNEIVSITRYDNPDSYIYPEKDFPENARLFRGFLWRGDEEIKSLDDLFPESELNEDEIARKKKSAIDLSNENPMEILKETLLLNNPDSKSNKKNKK